MKTLGFKLWFIGSFSIGFIASIINHSSAIAKTCVYISAYHSGYEYQDVLEKGLDPQLEGKCKVEKFHMDTKRNPDREFVKKRGLEAKKFIEEKKPDVVLVSTENAISDVLVAHFKNSKIPFVFFGVQWSVDRFGLPFENTTGIINVAQTKENLKELFKEVPNVKMMYYLGDDNETSRVIVKHQKKIFDSFGIELKPHYVKTFADWKKVYSEAQTSADALQLGGFASISDWDRKAALEHAEKNVQKFVISNSKMMLPFAVFANVTFPAEHGEWAGKAAVKILEGANPKSIPIATNKRFEPYYNPRLIKKIPFKLGENFMKKAKALEEEKK